MYSLAINFGFSIWMIVKVLLIVSSISIQLSLAASDENLRDRCILNTYCNFFLFFTFFRRSLHYYRKKRMRLLRNTIDKVSITTRDTSANNKTIINSRNSAIHKKLIIRTANRITVIFIHTQKKIFF